MGRGGRSEEDLSIAADIVEGVVEEGKDGEESLARSVGLPKWTESAAAAQGEAAWGGDCVTARSHVKCPIRACTHRRLERTYSILANPCYIYSQFTTLP